MKDSAYKQSGVDIDAAASLVERIKPHVKATARSGVVGGIGGFGALFDLKKTGYQDPVLVSSTDGVGTKIKVAIDLGHHDTIGIDCVAMCVNDIAVQGAEPLFFLDYFATGKLDNAVAERVIAGVAAGCRESGCALIGGETAEMPGLYAPGDYDLAGFAVGAVERTRIITGETMQEGDVVLGLASSGLHSNGFSLVRRLIETSQGYGYDSVVSRVDPDKTLGEAVLTPTRLYVRSVLDALKIDDAEGRPAIRGMAHITGGGLLENVPRVVPDSLTVIIDAAAWTLPPVFAFLREIGALDPHDMGTTLNCGIGMVVVCAPVQATAVAESFRAGGETVHVLGTVALRAAGQGGAVIQNMDTAWK